uniref:Coat protein n=1 Tax=Cinnamomum chago deltapartitivirus 1 TaxID=2765856 RepID=A0A8D9PH44_9VIRU|nr:TPA_exp: coat protein [Cinnamomum chago deltapartitivirus 1]
MEQNNPTLVGTTVQPTVTETRLPEPVPPAALSVASKRPELTRIADSLEDEYQIGFHRDRPRAYRRYVTLRRAELFERLHTLYVRQFNAHWQHFKRLVESFELEDGYTQHLHYAAACYLSCWFWDLYISNRESTRKISYTAFSQHYHTQQAFTFERFDPFLVHLNSVIRPTHIQFALEDTIYIPLIAETINWNSRNPFNIPGFTMNESLVQGLLDLMGHKNSEWKLESLSHDTLGRPMWLLDWRSNRAYAWFPEESNFTKEDLIAAHILGIPCSPRLGARDVDDWQIFPGGALPRDINLNELVRATPRRFFGSAEYRTISTSLWDIPMMVRDASAPSGSKRATLERGATPSGSSGASLAAPTDDTVQAPEPPQPVRVYRFQIIDWVYTGRVILEVNPQKQNQALRSFIFK